jgi:hypothetical protein
MECARGFRCKMKSDIPFIGNPHSISFFVIFQKSCYLSAGFLDVSIVFFLFKQKANMIRVLKVKQISATKYGSFNQVPVPILQSSKMYSILGNLKG